MALNRFGAMAVASAMMMAVLPLMAAGQDFTEIGCFADDGADRAFAGSTTPDPDDMSEAVCSARCESYPYYGLQYGVECWCGSYDEDDYGKYGESSGCTMPCSGDADATCGGFYANQVYTQASADLTAMACVKDSNDPRVFETSYTDTTGLTPEACIAHCSSEGYYYAGTQWGQECWCGSESADLDLHGYGRCTRPCSGDPTKFCGGSYEMTVYKTSLDSMCVKDDAGSRLFVMGMTDADGLTTDTCIEYCSGEGYYYAGTQYGSECWCGAEGTDIDAHGEGVCDFPCAGDSSETCGGYYAMNVYPTGTTGVPPTSTPGAIPETTSPTPLMTIPTSCTSDVRPTFRYAESSGVAGRLYAEGEGCFTMTDLYNFRGTESSGGAVVSKGPVYQLDAANDVYPGLVGDPVTNKWLLAAELYITGGAIFYCRGSDIGGDCDELRIQSTGSSDFHTIRGHGGSLYFENTIVTSWDTPNKTPQTEYEGGRSFLNCVSEKLTGEDCEGAAKNDMGECRMDIINSEMGYMGWFDAESYGLTWKVRGFCQDLSNPDVFETTNVYGDIIGSDIHHMYYGHYSYGHQGGVWAYNKMHDNWQYGFDPHDDSDYLTIAYNEVYNNVNHGIIASKRCNNVKIYDNVVYDGGAQAAGIFLHRSSDFAEVYNNQISNMQDAGIALLETFSANIYDNVIDGAKYGIRMSLGSANNMVYDNTFNDCSDYGLYTYEGSDAPLVDEGRPYDNTFEFNKITDTVVGVKFKRSDGIVVKDNEFTGTEELEFNDAQATEWSGNTLPDGVCVDNVTSDDGSSVDESTFADSDGLPSADCES